MRATDVAQRLGTALVAVALSGCLYTKVSDGLYLRDTLPAGQARGYAEFHLDPVIRDAPEFEKGGWVWVQWEKIWADSALKVRSFDLTTTQSVRFATPGGTQHFFIGTAHSGHRNVPIEVREGHVTKVVVRVIGQRERPTSTTSTYSGSALSVTTTTAGVAYDWIVDWSIAAPVPLDAAR
jgi:hypothetical protein